MAIEGQLVPVEWNDHDAVTRLAVLIDEDDDEIELDGADVDALLELVGEAVVVHGVLLTGTWGNRILRVSRVERGAGGEDA